MLWILPVYECEISVQKWKYTRALYFFLWDFYCFTTLKHRIGKMVRQSSFYTVSFCNEFRSLIAIDLFLFQARYFKESDIDGKFSFTKLHRKALFLVKSFLRRWFAEFRECFYLYSRSGKIQTLDELTVIMRSLNMSPTIAELRTYFRQAYFFGF